MISRSETTTIMEVNHDYVETIIQPSENQSEEVKQLLTSKLSPEADFVFAVGTSVIVVLAFLVNGISLLLFFRRIKKLSSVEMILLSVCIQSCFNSCRHVIVVLSAIRHQWILDTVSCHVYAGMSNFLNPSHAISLCSIAVLRYNRVCRTLDGAAKFDQKTEGFPVRYFAFIYLLPALFLWVSFTNYVDGYGPGPFGFYCTLTWHKDNYGALIYTVCLYMATAGIPGIILLYCYVNVVIKTRQARISLGDRNFKREAWVTRIAMYMGLAYFLSYLPVGIDVISKLITGRVLFSGVMKTFPTMCMRLSIISTPLIYVLLNRRYRKELANIVLRCNHKLQDSRAMTSVTMKSSPVGHNKG